MGSAGIQNDELWLRYYGNGGIVGAYEVEAYLQKLLSLPPLQRDLLALAANDLIDELPRRRAPYAAEDNSIDNGLTPSSNHEEPDEG